MVKVNQKKKNFQSSNQVHTTDSIIQVHKIQLTYFHMVQVQVQSPVQVQVLMY